MQQAVPDIFEDIGGHATGINQDGTLNTASNPAAFGSIVTVFLTGAGDVAGGRPDNRINTSLNDNPFPISVLSSANAQDGGLLSLEVLYDGDAPLEPSGVSQVNFPFAGGGPEQHAVPNPGGNGSQRHFLPVCEMMEDRTLSPPLDRLREKIGN